MATQAPPDDPSTEDDDGVTELSPLTFFRGENVPAKGVRDYRGTIRKVDDDDESEGVEDEFAPPAATTTKKAQKGHATPPD